MRLSFVVALAAMLVVASAAPAQKITALPAPAAPASGADQVLAIQGTGCMYQSAPCRDVRMSLAQIGTYIAIDPTVQAAYQPKNGNSTGNASTATKLATPRNINGVPFDGSADIGINAIDLTYRLIAASNLGDLTNPVYARINLGLGTLATQNGTFSGTSSGTNTGDQTIALTGDVTGSGTGAFSATLASVNSTPGTCGATNAIPALTVNSKGLTTGCTTGTALATVAVSGLDTDLAGAGWTKVGVAVDANGGTLGAGVTASARYKQIGKTVFIRVRVDLGASPGCSGCTAIRITLPVTPATTDADDQTVLFGRESAQIGFGIQGVIPNGVAQMVIAKAADNSYPGGTSYVLQLAGVFEAS